MVSYDIGDGVLVRYPLAQEKEADRDSWPWLPGSVELICGEDEWQILVEDESVSWIEDGELWYPLCYRDSTEIQRIK